MGWIIAGLALAAALMVVFTVQASVLRGRGIVLLGLALLRGVGALLR
jgi:hypothetical protein